MKMNMGTIDKTLRIILAIGIAFAWAAGYISGILAIVLLVVAGIFLFTSMVGVCPAYMPFRISTRKK
jgi:hypothetical protein